MITYNILSPVILNSRLPIKMDKDVCLREGRNDNLKCLMIQRYFFYCISTQWQTCLFCSVVQGVYRNLQTIAVTATKNVIQFAFYDLVHMYYLHSIVLLVWEKNILLHEFLAMQLLEFVTMDPCRDKFSFVQLCDKYGIFFVPSFSVAF